MVNYQTAMRQLINKPFLETPKWREQQGRAVRKGCHPDIIRFEHALVMDLRGRGMPFFCHSAFRTMQEQKELWLKGVTKAMSGESPHNHGAAVDIIHSVHGWEIDDRSWDIIGHIGHEIAHREKIDIQWGGEWTFYDPAHWELRDWQDVLANSDTPEGCQVK